MKFLPQKSVESQAVELTDAQKKSVVAELKSLADNGAPKDYYPDVETSDGPVSRTGEDLPVHAMISIATKKILNDRKLYPAVRMLLGEMIAEVAAMESISPAACKDLAGYKTELAKFKNHFTETEFATAKLEQYGVSTFEELKEAMVGSL